MFSECRPPCSWRGARQLWPRPRPTFVGVPGRPERTRRGGVLGAGGMCFGAADYLRRVRRGGEGGGGVRIVEESATGVGRTGQ